MKKIFLQLVILFLTINSFSQSDEHLKFKGIPIDGSLENFKKELTNKGFTHTKTDEGVSLFNGTFAGYQDCNIVAVSSEETRIVHRVGVMFSDKDNWETLYNNYSRLKDLLTQKYGNPTNVIEEFDYYKEPEDNTDKFRAVRSENCQYISEFQTTNGSITLKIINGDFSKANVMLIYYDNINSERSTQEALDDL